MHDAGRLLPLSEYDTSLVGAPPIDLLLHYPHPLDAAALGEHLGPVVEAFNVFASRLAAPDDGVLALVHDPDGVVFTVRPALAWPGGRLELELVDACVDRVRTMPGEPMTRITVTPVPGGTLLGFSVSHTVADAHSVQEFFRAWSRSIAGRGRPVAPVRRRYPTAPGDGRPPVELGTDRPLGGMTVHMPVDLRSLHPEVEIDYVGNAFIVVSERFEEAEVASLPHPAIAARLRACLARSLDRATLLARIRVRANGLEHRQLAWSDGQLLDPEGDIVASNLVRLRPNFLDLGSGPPAASLVPLPAPAGFVVLPALGGGDGVDVQLYAKHPLVL
jgi:hypothetical protein